MPEGAEIVHVHDQNGLPTIWALVDDSKPAVRRVFYVRGTGFNLIRDDTKYIGTTHNPPFVWHIFEIPEPETMEEKIKREFVPLSQKDLNTRMTI
jgi:hypothetical protein